MHLLRTSIRPYAWGSRTVIAELQGRPSPAEGPEAELWVGAHPSAPSRLPAPDASAAEVALDEAIRADPAGLLGAPVVARFGARLPYLLKFLAAERPLSLQVHPDPAQAAAGYAAEEAAGIPLGAPQRNYPDASHKPELLVAVTEFEALCGFRPSAEAAQVLGAFNVPQLRPVVDALAGPGDEASALRTAVHLLMDWPVAERAGLVSAVAGAAAGAAAGAVAGGRASWGDRPAGGRVAAAFGLAARLAEGYPADVGVIVALLLNHVRLRPGEAVWMPAGNLHAYVRGAGIEVMAASDNVLRGGLTAKHVDVPELLRVLRFEALRDPIMRPVKVDDQVTTWSTPAEEFRLFSAEVAGRVTLPDDGPRSIICTRGRVTLTARDERLDLLAGQAAFVPAGLPAVAATGTATLFQAGTP
ncbi:mannose-6-phosphate isomerase, class I [Luedemannella helvata]|uniref:mannose-6-phosphate isomerase n=1 Tax=Luedemannella helvata TaxID=349315 RepID=A0ABP4W2D0_9ACTN